MTDARRALHDLVRRLLDAWVDDRAEEFADACSADVTWWLPVGDAALSGRQEVWRMLQDVRTSAGGDLRVDSVVTAEDGSMAVVEMTATALTDTTSVTSVISADAGRVIAGRTYLDVEVLPVHLTDRGAG